MTPLTNWLSLEPLISFLEHHNLVFQYCSYVLLGLGCLIVFLYIYIAVYREYMLSYGNLNGPASSSVFWGNIPDFFKLEIGDQHIAWTQKFGLTFRYRILFGSPRISTADPVALNYILTHHDSFPKPTLSRKFLCELMGNGVLVVEGQDHRRQRRVLNQCFSQISTKSHLSGFFDKAEELKMKFLGLIEDDFDDVASPTPTKEGDEVEGGRKIDVMLFVGQCTIDIIGLTGFGYDMQAMRQPNELAEAFNETFRAGQIVDAVTIAQALIPGASRLPTQRSKAMWASQATTQRIGKQLIEEKKRVILEAQAAGLSAAEDLGEDLLSSCVRAMLVSDQKPEFRLSEEEVLAQISTFMLAGNETSATALTWTLYLLSQNPEEQAKLREECLSISTSRPSFEELSAMPYLGAVVHESLRLIAPVQSTIRQAGKDLVIPLGTPMIGRNGEMMNHLNITKGTTLHLPINVINTLPEIWGPDAHIFNPSRHLPSQPGYANDFEKTQLRDKQNKVPGTWGNILSFLGGTRNCIGYRFALTEIKVILFVLIRGLEFQELASKPVIEKRTFIVARPRVADEEEAGLQMPLMVKPVHQ